MNFEIIFVLLGLIGMLVALIKDKMRPGIVLLSLVVLLMVVGIITPQQMVAGFSNRGMITVALLFLVSEGIRQSGALSAVVKKLLPNEKTSVAIRFFEQYAGGGHLCADIEKLVKTHRPLVYEVPDTAFLCHHLRWFVYADRHFHELGGAWYDDRPWL